MSETKQAEARRFRNQFPVKVTLENSAIELLQLETVAFDKYPVYRCLNRLFILDSDGCYYGAH